MNEDAQDIVIVADPIAPEELKRLVLLHFGDMVKIVVDLERRVVAAGGELHADAEQLLLQDGSRQSDLWGANYFPGQDPEECIQYTALINIRPTQANRGMLIADPEIRRRVQEITFALIGRGEPLP